MSNAAFFGKQDLELCLVSSRLPFLDVVFFFQAECRLLMHIIVCISLLSFISLNEQFDEMSKGLGMQSVERHFVCT